MCAARQVRGQRVCAFTQAQQCCRQQTRPHSASGSCHVTANTARPSPQALRAGGQGLRHHVRVRSPAVCGARPAACACFCCAHLPCPQPSAPGWRRRAALAPVCRSGATAGAALHPRRCSLCGRQAVPGPSFCSPSVCSLAHVALPPPRSLRTARRRLKQKAYQIVRANRVAAAP